MRYRNRINNELTCSAAKYDGTFESIESLNIPEAEQFVGSKNLTIPNSEIVAKPGQYIVDREDGQFFLCEADLFERNYERVEQ